MDDKKQELSFFGGRFWSLWFMKVFRNFASMKFMLLAAMYVPVIWGMFHLIPGTQTPWISSTIGIGFMGGGFLTLVSARILANTNLTNGNNENYLNTDK
jgi:hypothetical protein